MPRNRPPYPAEFRAEAIKLVRPKDKAKTRIACELGVSVWALTKWVKQAKNDVSGRSGLATDAWEESRRLRH